MMDLVYICRRGDNEELRYSLRSIEKNFPNQTVWVVGYKPNWYNGNFVPIEDISSKFNNIRIATLAICDIKEISNNFILMNDDFFLLKPIKRMPTFNGGLLANKIVRYRQVAPTSAYSILLKQTFDYLKYLGIDNPIDYDLHVPMPMNKQKLSCLKGVTASLRSVYGNVYGIKSKQITDVKTYSKNNYMKTLQVENLDPTFISSEDDSFGSLRRKVLLDMFPEPSKYESP